MLCVVSYPEALDPQGGRSNVNKKHNAAVKAALKRCLIAHHKYNVPKHFRFGAHAKYKYGNRSEVTKFIKSKQGKKYLDLVLTGRAKQKFTGPWNSLRVGGTTYGGVGAINATMNITWPPGYYDRALQRPGTITKAKMRDEIETWTEQEQRQMASLFRDYYVEEMRKRFAVGGRVTKRFSSQLQAQGII